MNLVALLAAFLLFSLGVYVSWDLGTLYRCLFGGLDFVVLAMILGGLALLGVGLLLWARG